MNKFDFDFYDYPERQSVKDSTVLFGGSLDKSIPVDALCESFGFNFTVINCSSDSLSLRNAKNHYIMNAEKFNPEAVILHLGEADMDMFKSNPSDFDSLYLEFISYLRSTNSKIRIQLVSIGNETNNQFISDMNRHIKAIAAAERCEFFTIESARLWKPCSTTAAASFLYKIGFDRQLTVKHPLYDTSKALFSYVFAKGFYQPRTA